MDITREKTTTNVFDEFFANVNLTMCYKRDENDYYSIFAMSLIR